MSSTVNNNVSSSFANSGDNKLPQSGKLQARTVTQVKGGEEAACVGSCGSCYWVVGLILFGIGLAALCGAPGLTNVSHGGALAMAIIGFLLYGNGSGACTAAMAHATR